MATRAGLIALLILIAPVALSAQVNWGAHVAHADDVFDGTYGVGVRGGIDLPALPFDLMGSAEYFFPDCPSGQSGCGFWGASLDANFRMVFPVVRPYISTGLVYRNFSPGGNGPDDTGTGIALGLGADVSLAGVRIFGETRYEFVTAPEREFVWRIGMLFGF